MTEADYPTRHSGETFASAARALLYVSRSLCVALVEYRVAAPGSLAESTCWTRCEMLFAEQEVYRSYLADDAVADLIIKYARASFERGQIDIAGKSVFETDDFPSHTTLSNSSQRE